MKGYTQKKGWQFPLQHGHITLPWEPQLAGDVDAQIAALPKLLVFDFPYYERYELKPLYMADGIRRKQVAAGKGVKVDGWRYELVANSRQTLVEILEELTDD